MIFIYIFIHLYICMHNYLYIHINRDRWMSICINIYKLSWKGNSIKLQDETKYRLESKKKYVLITERMIGVAAVLEKLAAPSDSPLATGEVYWIYLYLYVRKLLCVFAHLCMYIYVFILTTSEYRTRRQCWRFPIYNILFMIHGYIFLYAYIWTLMNIYIQIP
jgi:hypothetical protein